MKQISGKCMMVLVCLMLAGCGSKTELYLEPSGTEVSESGESGVGQAETGKPGTEISVEDSGRTIAVYVCGEVKVPGVYELTEGMRICDAIEAAGGFTKKAGREYWNLAEPLTDGQMLCVPTEEEAKKRESAVTQMQTASESDGLGSAAMVNINTADAALLTSVPGIGQVRAEAVIAYRKEHGSFQQIEDIKKVSGIGDALFAKMKDYITVS